MRMDIVLSGGTGFIGKALRAELARQGHKVVVLARANAPVGPNETPALWDGRSEGPWARHVDGADAVVNLAGEPVVGGRWTGARKRQLEESRVLAAKALVEAMAAAKKKPHAFVSASAVGYYGDVPDGDVTEESPNGSDFLARLCARWEAEAGAASEIGVRTVVFRLGVVLGPGGGALAKMVPPFRLFIGGPLGSGLQWLPWVSLEDVTGAVLFAIQDYALAGPVNLTAPDPLRMKDFCATLGRALGRPSWAPVPGFMLRLLMGEAAGMLLGGQRALPKKLLAAGFRFRHPDADSALRAVFAKG